MQKHWQDKLLDDTWNYITIAARSSGASDDVYEEVLRELEGPQSILLLTGQSAYSLTNLAAKLALALKDGGATVVPFFLNASSGNDTADLYAMYMVHTLKKVLGKVDSGDSDWEDRLASLFNGYSDENGLYFVLDGLEGLDGFEQVFLENSPDIPMPPGVKLIVTSSGGLKKRLQDGFEDRVSEVKLKPLERGDLVPQIYKRCEDLGFKVTSSTRNALLRLKNISDPLYMDLLFKCIHLLNKQGKDIKKTLLKSEKRQSKAADLITVYAELMDEDLGTDKAVRGVLGSIALTQGGMDEETLLSIAQALKPDIPNDLVKMLKEELSPFLYSKEDGRIDFASSALKEAMLESAGDLPELSGLILSILGDPDTGFPPQDYYTLCVNSNDPKRFVQYLSSLYWYGMEEELEALARDLLAHSKDLKDSPIVDLTASDLSESETVTLIRFITEKVGPESESFSVKGGDLLALLELPVKLGQSLDMAMLDKGIVSRFIHNAAHIGAIYSESRSPNKAVEYYNYARSLYNTVKGDGLPGLSDIFGLEIIIRLGDAFCLSGNYREAEKCYKAALKEVRALDPTRMSEEAVELERVAKELLESLKFQSQLFSRDEEDDWPEEESKKKVSVSALRNLANLANQYTAESKYQKAEAILKGVINDIYEYYIDDLKGQRLLVQALDYFGSLKYIRGDCDTALGALSLARKIFKDHVEAHANKLDWYFHSYTYEIEGDIYLYQEHVQKAKECYRKDYDIVKELYRKHPGDSSVLIAYCNAIERMASGGVDSDDMETALHYTLKLLEVTKRIKGIEQFQLRGIAYDRLNSIYKKRGEYALAVDACRQAIKCKLTYYDKEGYDASAYGSLAQSYRFLAESEMFLGHFEESLETFKEAKKYWKKYSKLNPSSVADFLSMVTDMSESTLLEAMNGEESEIGQMEAFAAYAESLNETAPAGNPEITNLYMETLVNLGDACSKVGDYAKACSAYRKLLKLIWKHGIRNSNELMFALKVTFRLGAYYEDLRDFDSAVGVYEGTLKSIAAMVDYEFSDLEKRTILEVKERLKVSKMS